MTAHPVQPARSARPLDPRHAPCPVDAAGDPAPGTSAATVVIEELSYCYPAWSDVPQPALREVTLRLDPGFTLVQGDSGSGKSTLLRLLNGLVPHFHGGSLRGRASVCGLDVASTPTRQLARQVGFVFQEPEAGFVRGTVAREVAFFPENLGLPEATVRRRVDEALAQAGIEHLASRRLRTLSGGERQRVALAAALAAAPSVVVLDEPMSQLDREGASNLTATLSALAAGGTTVVVAEHRLGALASGLARRVHLVGGAVAAGPEMTTAPGASGDPGGTTAPAAPGATTAPADPGATTDVHGPAPMARTGREVWSLTGATVGVAGRPLLEGLDVAGAAGDVLIVTGPNGSGKTTLLRTVAGLSPPLGGRAERAPGRVAYLPQEPGLLLHRNSVRAEIDQTLRWSKSAAPADEVLDVLGLRALAERDPRDLSGGQRQRAALAVVLAGRPELALLDEPTRGMDAAARASLAVTLRRLADQGAAVVVATHDLALARELRGRVLQIQGHRLVADPGGTG